MARTNKQEELMNTTYVVVAENGIDTFSMKTVTSRLGVSEGLIYKYFDTREGLLLKSFVAFENQIAQYLNTSLELNPDGESREERRERIWKEYYKFFLNNNYKSLFYFEYRWSYRYAEYKKLLEESGNSYESGMQQFATAVLGHPALNVADREMVSWIVESTGMYVRKALLGEIEKDEVTIHNIYRRIFFGVGAPVE